MYLEKALEFDSQSNIQKAIEYYKKSIEHHEEREEAYSNLIVILIEINYDYGVSLSLIRDNVIKQDDMLKLYNLLNDLLREADEKFKSKTNEFIFWRYYCDVYFGNFDRKKLLDIIEMNSNVLIPYFFLYINDLSSRIPSAHYMSKINSLKESLKSKAISKNKYIESLIKSSENIFK